MTKRISNPLKHEIQRSLEAELKQITTFLGLRDTLKVTWTPSSKELAGQVIGDTIYIYDSDLVEAVSTLKHEVVDYLVCKAVKPYKELLNVLIKMINDKAYTEKENVVESLVRILAPAS